MNMVTEAWQAFIAVYGDMETCVDCEMDVTTLYRKTFNKPVFYDLHTGCKSHRIELQDRHNRVIDAIVADKATSKRVNHWPKDYVPKTKRKITTIPLRTAPKQPLAHTCLWRDASGEINTRDCVGCIEWRRTWKAPVTALPARKLIKWEPGARYEEAVREYSR